MSGNGTGSPPPPESAEELIRRDLDWVYESARRRGTDLLTVIRATRKWIWDLVHPRKP